MRMRHVDVDHRALPGRQRGCRLLKLLTLIAVLGVLGIETTSFAALLAAVGLADRRSVVGTAGQLRRRAVPSVVQTVQGRRLDLGGRRGRYRARNRARHDDDGHGGSRVHVCPQQQAVHGQRAELQRQSNAPSGPDGASAVFNRSPRPSVTRLANGRNADSERARPAGSTSGQSSRSARQARCSACGRIVETSTTGRCISTRTASSTRSASPAVRIHAQNWATRRCEQAKGLHHLFHRAVRRSRLYPGTSSGRRVRRRARWSERLATLTACASGNPSPAPADR